MTVLVIGGRRRAVRASLSMDMSDVKFYSAPEDLMNILNSLSVLAICVWLATIATAAEEGDVTQRLVDAPPAPAKGAVKPWPSQPPPGCPFEASRILTGIAFTGRHAEYTGADTWYPSWASDDNMYSPWTDGAVNGLGSTSAGKDATTGSAKIIGSDPLQLRVVEQAVYKSDPSPYVGRYPCGSLVYNGVWYYGTYCLHPSGGVPRGGTNYNWPWLGPFVGFRYSTDLGKTWTQTPCSPAQPLFGEHALNGEPTRMGCPHFVDFGKNMEGSPDGKAYLVSHGASDGANRRFAYNSWITGDEIYLARVKPALDSMNNSKAYEFFAGPGTNDEPSWSGDFARLQPIAKWRDNMGCVTITWNAPLRKYLLCVTDGGNTVHYFNTYILESDRVTGPWKLVSYLRHFGEQAYFVNIPSRFISSDGRTFWLCYAANFSSGWGGVRFQSRPPGSRYAMCLQEVKLLGPDVPVPQPTILDSENNIAPQATVSVSSTHPDYTIAGLTDGIVDGFPREINREWCTRGEQSTAMLRLNWATEQTISSVWLFDRPNDLDQVKSGLLVFSDGTTIRTRELPDDARQGLEVRFPPKKVRWLLFAFDELKQGSPNIGLAEIAVFRAN